MTLPRPLVLLSNDDGYRARGIQLLKHAISAWADVVVCAPENEQSTTSHSLSLYRPLRLARVSVDRLTELVTDAWRMRAPEAPRR